jgi:hypothetical protein
VRRYNQQVETTPPARREWSFESYAPLSGFVALVLILTGSFITFSSEPSDPTGAELAAWYKEDTLSILLGLSLIFYGFAFFTWFASSLRSRVLAAEGGLGRIATLVFAGAFGLALSLMAAFAPSFSAAIQADEEDVVLTPAAADIYYSVGDGFFLIGMSMMLVLLVAIGLASLRYQAFPKWFGILSLVLALPLLFPPVAWAVVIFGFPIWLFIASFICSWDAFKSRPVSAPDPGI